MTVEWDCELVDEHGDIQDHNHFDKLVDALAYQREHDGDGGAISIVLVRDTVCEFDGLIQRFWAYVENGVLPDVMYSADDSETNTPKRYLREAERELPLPKLSEVLEALGYTHERAGEHTYAHYIYKDGEHVFTGTAADVWEWLVERGESKNGRPYPNG